MGFSTPEFDPRRIATKSMTLNVNNTTGSLVMFTVTGSVKIHSLRGEVTTVISSNHTAAHIRIDDQTAQVDVSLNTGVTVSSAPVGSIINRTGLVSSALTVQSSAAGAVRDAPSAGNDIHSSFQVTKKTGAVTTIDYRYTTTNAPSSGVILWTAVWEPISADGNLA